jgi:hypothetical protein
MRTFNQNGIYPGKPLTVNQRFEKLYHYTSFNTFVKIWCTKKLKFGITNDVNDILEATKSIQVEVFQLPLMFAYEDIKNSYKQISFTMDYDTYIKGCMSPLMWGIYGDKRKGVCIEFDFSKLNFPENCLMDVVDYLPNYYSRVSLPSHLKSINDIENFVKQNAKEIFFTKHDSWKNENEFRLLSNNLDFLDINNAITAIYLTSHNSTECICVENLVQNECMVKYLNFQNIGNGKESIPTILDTKSGRELLEKSINLPTNCLPSFQKQAYDHFISLKQDENASLLKFDFNTSY